MKLIILWPNKVHRHFEDFIYHNVMPSLPQSAFHFLEPLTSVWGLPKWKFLKKKKKKKKSYAWKKNREQWLCPPPVKYSSCATASKQIRTTTSKKFHCCSAASLVMLMFTWFWCNFFYGNKVGWMNWIKCWKSQAINVCLFVLLFCFDLLSFVLFFDILTLLATLFVCFFVCLLIFRYFNVLDDFTPFLNETNWYLSNHYHVALFYSPLQAGLLPCLFRSVLYIQGISLYLCFGLWCVSFVCLFNRSLRAEIHLGPDGTRPEQNAQSRLKSLYKHAGQLVYENVKTETDCPCLLNQPLTTKLIYVCQT